MADDTHNGYSKDELTFVEEPPKLLELECPVCLKVMLSNPHLVSCCGNNFCGPCIKKIQKAKGPCPLCMENNYQAMIDKKTQRNINSLHIYCINNKEGCEWKGELKDLSSHLQQGKREGECQYVRVQCKYCKLFEDQRYKISGHETKDCPNRPYSCDYCSYSGTHYFVTWWHYSKCLNYPIFCPYNCTQDAMPRYQLKDHLDTSCPLQPVECEFGWAGCEVKPTRQDISKHCSDNLQQHLSLACDELKKENKLLKKENAEINEEVAEMKKENTKIKKENAEIKRENTKIKEDVAKIKARLKIA